MTSRSASSLSSRLRQRSRIACANHPLVAYLPTTRRTTLVLALGALAYFASPVTAGPLFGVYSSAASTFGFGCGQTTSYSTAAGASYSSGTPQAGVACNLGPASSTPSGPGGVITTSLASGNLVFNSISRSGLTDTVSASASADLTTGELHLYSSDTNNFAGNGGGGIGPVAIAGYNDTLYFVNPGETANSVWFLTTTFTYDGTVTNPANLGIGAGNGTYVNLNGQGALWGWGGADSGCSTSSSGVVTTCTDSSWTTTVTTAITGQTATLPIGMGMWLDAAGNDVANFSHTASVSFSMPPNVSYTSASGVFMTASSSAVPEPGAGWLALIGLGLVGGRRIPGTRLRRGGVPDVSQS